jgi:hypothetical protein
MKSTYCEYTLEKILSTSEVGPILAPSPFLKNDGKMFKYYKRLDDVLMFKKQSLP